MGSIYKKGRDGYYYYQAYVFNPKTKKKDKRIFHALGTKDILEAQSKKEQLDKKYENRYVSRLTYKSKKFKMVFISIIVLLISTIYYIHQSIKGYEMKTYSRNVQSADIYDYPSYDSSTVNEDYIQIKEPEKKDTIELNELKETSRTKIVKSTIPKHTIERVEIISDAFRQGKIHVTTSAQASDYAQLALCKKLTNQFSEFSNIIICLYADDNAGKKIANGLEKSLSIKEKKFSWLAMYTFNSVEGEYFDENPGDYLGNF